MDRRKGIENTASFKANGTGPFRLKERQPSTRTVLVRNPDYWKKVESNIDEVVFTPIGNDGTRVAALLSGEIDLMEPVPLQAVERIKASGRFTVLQGPEVRTIFLGMDHKRDELLFSSVKGRNPFKDRRVRQAFYPAIDIDAIRSQVMRNAATPTALMIGPGIRGFQPDMNQRLPHDTEAARKLMAEAGYPNGFELGMNCPNDRYVNDSAICQAVAASLSRIGVKIQLQAEPKSSFFPKLMRRDTSFYLQGWSPIGFDAHDVLRTLLSTPDGQGQGAYNVGDARPSGSTRTTSGTSRCTSRPWPGPMATLSAWCRRRTTSCASNGSRCGASELTPAGPGGAAEETGAGALRGRLRSRRSGR